VGLAHRLHHKPNELSGGQQQRVAIARALANDPLMILADEATGNLDSKSGKEILDIFDDLNAAGKTMVFVTHDERMVQRCTRVIRLKDGLVEKDEPGAAAGRLIASGGRAGTSVLTHFPVSDSAPDEEAIHLPAPALAT
jgi:putative ABC transport system ATP-binding protein